MAVMQKLTNMKCYSLLTNRVMAYTMLSTTTNQLNPINSSQIESVAKIDFQSAEQVQRNVGSTHIISHIVCPTMSHAVAYLGWENVYSSLGHHSWNPIYATTHSTGRLTPNLISLSSASTMSCFLCSSSRRHEWRHKFVWHCRWILSQRKTSIVKH